jgi:hypothetical protein
MGTAPKEGHRGASRIGELGERDRARVARVLASLSNGPLCLGELKGLGLMGTPVLYAFLGWMEGRGLIARTEEAGGGAWQAKGRLQADLQGEGPPAFRDQRLTSPFRSEVPLQLEVLGL